MGSTAMHTTASSINGALCKSEQMYNSSVTIN